MMTKGFFSAGTAVLVATLAFTHIPVDEGSLFCSCSQTVHLMLNYPLAIRLIAVLSKFLTMGSVGLHGLVVTPIHFIL